MSGFAMETGGKADGIRTVYLIRHGDYDHTDKSDADVGKALGVDTEAWLGMSIGNCSLTVVAVEADGAMKLLSFSDVGHLPPNLQTRTAPGTAQDLSVPGGVAVVVN